MKTTTPPPPATAPPQALDQNSDLPVEGEARGRGVRLKNAAGSLLRWSGVLSVARRLGRRGAGRRAVPLIGRRVRRAFHILGHHRVNDAADPFFPSVATGPFARELKFLKRNYRVLPLWQIVEGVRKRNLPEGAVAITFDDGYRDNHDVAYPILKRHGVPATFFLVTGAIDTGRALWYDRVAAVLRDTRQERAVVEAGGERIELDLATTASRVRSLRTLLRIIKNLPGDRLRRLVEGMGAQLDVDDKRLLRGEMMTWDMVRSMAHAGMDFGAHTITHPILSRVSREEAWREIDGSRRELGAALGRAPEGFAYPNGMPGDYDAEIRDMVRRSGFQYACARGHRVNATDTDLFELLRWSPANSLSLLAVQVEWMYYS
jgi:peptidoglycan/xylan/chitin deacetylase (PgdA/CDA1 family)